jgi:hypothetical protein
MRAKQRHPRVCGICATTYASIGTLLLILCSSGLGLIGPSLQRDLCSGVLTAALAVAAVSWLARILRRKAADRHANPCPYA